MSPSLPSPAGPPIASTSHPVWAPPGSPLAPQVTPEPPSRSRRPLVLVASVVALIVLGVGAVVALSGNGDSDSSEAAAAAAPFSLEVALEQTAQAQTVQFDMAVAVAGEGEITVSGAVDNDAQLMTTTVDLGSMIGIGDSNPLGDVGSMEMIVDIGNGVVYMNAEAMGGLLPVNAPWLSIDLESMAELGGQSLDDLGAAPAIDTNEVATMLLDAGEATEVGPETIDGVETKHFEVTVGLDGEIPAQVQDQLDSAELDLESIDLPDSITYDVWVTENNELRRVAIDQSFAGQDLQMEINLLAVGEPVDISVPADGDVMDLTSLLDLRPGG